MTEEKDIWRGEKEIYLLVTPVGVCSIKTKA